MQATISVALFTPTVRELSVFCEKTGSRCRPTTVLAATRLRARHRFGGVSGVKKPPGNHQQPATRPVHSREGFRLPQGTAEAALVPAKFSVGYRSSCAHSKTSARQARRAGYLHHFARSGLNLRRRWANLIIVNNLLGASRELQNVRSAPHAVDDVDVTAIVNLRIVGGNVIVSDAIHVCWLRI